MNLKLCPIRKFTSPFRFPFLAFPSSSVENASPKVVTATVHLASCRASNRHAPPPLAAPLHAKPAPVAATSRVTSSTAFASPSMCTPAPPPHATTSTLPYGPPRHLLAAPRAPRSALPACTLTPWGCRRCTASFPPTQYKVFPTVHLATTCCASLTPLPPPPARGYKSHSTLRQTLHHPPHHFTVTSL